MKKILILVLVLCLPLAIGCDLYKDKTASFSQKTDKLNLPFEDGRYLIDKKGCTIYWQASKGAGDHMGAISLKSGEIEVVGGQPQSGSIVLDMDSITNADINDASERQNFVNELKSDKYFSVADYPLARFDITQIRPAGSADTNGKNEGANYVIEGDLSLKNKTRPASILAKIEATEEGLTILGTADAGTFTLEVELSLERLVADGD